MGACSGMRSLLRRAIAIEAQNMISAGICKLCERER
jgi:hypothetical protein